MGLKLLKLTYKKAKPILFLINLTQICNLNKDNSGADIIIINFRSKKHFYFYTKEKKVIISKWRLTAEDLKSDIANVILKELTKNQAKYLLRELEPPMLANSKYMQVSSIIPIRLPFGYDSIDKIRKLHDL